MTKIRMLAVLAAIATFQATGGVQDVSIAQDAVTRNITVSYTLTADAVVTIDICTNGIPINARLLASMAGDVNRKVAAGARMAFWRPDRSWPGYNFDANVTARVTAWPIDNPPDFMVIDMLYPSNITYYASTDAMPYDLTNTLYKTDKLVMRKIPAKGVRWRMGGGTETGNNYSDWRSREVYHYVTFTNDYYMAIFPTTTAQYRRIGGGAIDDVEDAAQWHIAHSGVYYSNLRGTVAGGFDWPDTGHAVPRTNTSYDGRIMRLRDLTGVDSLDLPTEAQWEYACRAGTGTAYNNGKNLSGLWNAAPDGIAVAGKSIVGTKPCNNWNLYDCHGNVAEWCLDWYVTAPYAENSEQTDPPGPRSSDSPAPTTRVLKGGGFNVSDCGKRSAFREGGNPDGYVEKAGFRLKCDAVAR